MQARGFSIDALLQSRWAEALGAAGCAAFFVSVFAVSLEWRLERSRNLQLPEFRLQLPAVTPHSHRWAFAAPEVTQPETEAPRVASVPKSDRVVISQARSTTSIRGWLEGFTQRLLRAKRISWAGVAREPATSGRPLLVASVTTQPPRIIKKVTPPRAKPAQPQPVNIQPEIRHPQEALVAEAQFQKRLEPKAVIHEVAHPIVKAEQVLPPVVRSEPWVEREPEVRPVPEAISVAAQTITAEKPEPTRAPRGLQMAGWIAANTQIQFSPRPSRVVFTDHTGVAEEVRVSSDGRVFSPAGSVGVSEYSFRAWLDRPSQRPTPVIVSISPTTSPTTFPTTFPTTEGPTSEEGKPEAASVLAATFLRPDGSTELLDFRDAGLSETQLQGQVFEAEAAGEQPVAGVEVGLVGSPEKMAITDAEGRFDLGVIRIAAGGRAFLEARRPDGFKHRFEVSPRERQALFIFSEQQISQWQGAFEGGLSPQSGWIVGAFSDPRMSDGLRPEVAVPGARSKITPETYAIGPKNQLAPLGQGQSSARWLSVEVPAGAARVRLVTPEGRTAREFWEPVSPGVINVIRVDAEN